MIPTTTHKGFKITFSETMERWECHEIGKSSPTLKGVRALIDTHVRNIRKGVAIDAFEMPGIFRFQNLNQDMRVVSLKPARVVEYLGVDSSRYGAGPVQVAVMPEGGSRKKTALSSLYKATPENEAIAERAHQKGLEAVSAINQMNMILDELERLEAKDVEALARIADVDEAGDT